MSRAEDEMLEKMRIRDGFRRKHDAVRAARSDGLAFRAILQSRDTELAMQTAVKALNERLPTFLDDLAALIEESYAEDLECAEFNVREAAAALGREQKPARSLAPSEEEPS